MHPHNLLGASKQATKTHSLAFCKKKNRSNGEPVLAVASLEFWEGARPTRQVIGSSDADGQNPPGTCLTAPLITTHTAICRLLGITICAATCA